MALAVRYSRQTLMRAMQIIARDTEASDASVVASTIQSFKTRRSRSILPFFANSPNHIEIGKT